MVFLWFSYDFGANLWLSGEESPVWRQAVDHAFPGSSAQRSGRLPGRGVGAPRDGNSTCEEREMLEIYGNFGGNSNMIGIYPLKMVIIHGYYGSIPIKIQFLGG